MNYSIEQSEQANYSRYSGKHNTCKELSEIAWINSCIFEYRNAKGLKNTPQVEYENYKARNIFGHNMDSNFPIPWI